MSSGGPPLDDLLTILADDGLPTGAAPDLDACCAAGRQILGAAVCGLLLGPDGPPTVVAGRTPGLDALVAAERAAGHGPDQDARSAGAVSESEDLRADARWPGLAASGAADAVPAVLVAPVRIGDRVVGTMVAGRDAPGPWTEHDRAAASAYALVLGQLVAAALETRRAVRRSDQLQFALDYRVVIERAVGYLMLRDGVADDVAFERLRQRARSTRTRIVDVAAGLLETGRWPDPAREPI